MNLIKKFFQKSGSQKPQEPVSLSDIGVNIDMHSHLIPGIDDGSDSMEESIEMIRLLKDVGYSGLITTPHVMADFYRNTSSIIKKGEEEVLKAIEEAGIDIKFQASAEYYLDENFIDLLKAKDLLPFGDNYILVETSFMNEPDNLEHTFFDMQLAGYKPIFAHPERYLYLYDDFDKYRELYDKGIDFQININSILGYYSPQAKAIAEKLIDENMVEFVGTDTHKPRHIDILRKTLYTHGIRKLIGKKLKNYSLFDAPAKGSIK